jgi:hypothetical protein
VLPGDLVWVLPALVAGLGSVGRGYRGRIAGLVWILAFVGALLVAALAPAVFVPWRSLAPLVPVLLLAGAYGLDVLVHRINQWSVSRWTRGLACSVVLGFVGVSVLAPLELYGDRKPAKSRQFQSDLRALAPLLEGGTVASTLPWYVIANTSSPSVSIPNDGENAIAQVLLRYRVEWLLLPKNIEHLKSSTGPINLVLRGRKNTLGPHRLTLEKKLDHASLFRVELSD